MNFSSTFPVRRAPAVIAVWSLVLAAVLVSGCKRSPDAPAPSTGPEGQAQPKRPTVTANPNPAPAGSAKFAATTVTWDTGDGSIGEVYVSVNGGPEQRFSGALAKG